MEDNESNDYLSSPSSMDDHEDTGVLEKKMIDLLGNRFYKEVYKVIYDMVLIIWINNRLRIIIFIMIQMKLRKKFWKF